jgi:hypothetical protein
LEQIDKEGVFAELPQMAHLDRSESVPG